MGITERKERHKTEIRQKILDAAKTLAGEKDWNAVTVRNIADKIDYAAPIVYQFFKNKEDVLLNIVKDGFRELKFEIEQIVSLDVPPEEKLMKVSLLYWDFASSKPEIFNLMFSLERMACQRELIQEELAEIKSLIGELLKKLTKENIPIEEVFLNWACLMMGYVSLLSNINPRMREKEIADKLKQENKDPKKFFENAVTRFIRSL